MVSHPQFSVFELGCDYIIYHIVDFKFISRDVPRELHAPIKNNEKW